MAFEGDSHLASLLSILSLGSLIKNVFDIGSMTGYSARLTYRDLQAELRSPDVDYIEADQTLTINYIQEDATSYTVQSNATWVRMTSSLCLYLYVMIGS